MSKLDAQRAMREANYARRQTDAPARPRVADDVPVAPPPTSRTKPAARSKVSEPAVGACGHRSMNGRACTREAGHSEKSHRYS